MKLNKTNLALGLLAIVSLLMAIRFDSGVVFTIGFLVILAVRNLAEVSAENVASGVRSATIGELIDERITRKAWDKTVTMPGEEKVKLADQLVREIGSDTGPIKLNNH